jgi:hypothetical protein
MCGGISLLISYYLLGHYLVPYHSMCVNNNNMCVCELGEESCTCVKKK